MPNFKKHRVNPYLFILLKRMLEYEVCGIGERPSRLQIAEFIYARWKRKELKTTSYNSSKEVRDSIAFTKAESIRKDLLTPKDFEFSNDKLNQLAAEISIIDRFSSWNEYVTKYESDMGAKIAARDFSDLPFSELTDGSQQKISAWAEDKLIKLHFENMRNGRGNNHKIIRSTDAFVIRTISLNEISEISTASYFPHDAGFNRAHWVKELVRKNSNTFYIYKDDYDVWGQMFFLPVKEKSLRKLDMTDLKLNGDDIYSPEEKESVKYVYLADFSYKHEFIRRLFINDLSSIISHLAILKDDLIVCGNSLEFSQWLISLGFFQSTSDPPPDWTASFQEDELPSSFFGTRQMTKDELEQISWKELSTALNHGK